MIVEASKRVRDLRIKVIEEEKENATHDPVFMKLISEKERLVLTAQARCMKKVSLVNLYKAINAAPDHHYRGDYYS